MARVAYILTPITFGGSEKVSLNFLKNVNREKYQIHPILLTRPWEEEPYFAKELQKHRYSYECVPVAVRRKGDPLRVLRVAKRIYSILKSDSFDLVHTHGYFADICGLPTARLLGIPGISTCHGFISNDRNLKFYNTLDKIALRLCKKIIAVSDVIRDDLLHVGLDGARIVVMKNAVGNDFEEKDFQRFRLEKRSALSIDADDFVIGFVGRLSEEKGAKYLIEAASEMKSRDMRFKIIIVGDGPERERLSNMIEEMRLGENVFFTGFQKNGEEWFPAFDVFVLPSLTEGTPMALLEAMSMGIPVIASDVGGVPDVIEDGVNGFLVKPKNVSMLASRIDVVMRNKSLREVIVRNGLKTIKKDFDIHNWCRELEKQYQLILHPRSLPNGHPS